MSGEAKSVAAPAEADTVADAVDTERVRPTRVHVEDARTMQREAERRLRFHAETRWTPERLIPAAGHETTASSERAGAIDEVIAASRGWPADLSTALAGYSALGPVSASEHRDMIRSAVEQWSEHGALGDGVGALEVGTHMFPETAERTSRTLAELAVDGLAPDEPRFGGDSDRLILADAAIRSAPGPEALRRALDESGPGLAWGLQLNNDGLFAGKTPGRDTRVYSASRLLDAASTGPATETTALTTQLLFEGARSDDYKYYPHLAESMSRALGHHWHPNDPEQARAEGERFSALLATPAGADVLGRSNVPDAARVRALAELRKDPALMDTLASHEGPGWIEPELNRRLAEPRAERFLATRGDDPQALEGPALINTVGVAMGFSPHVPEDETPEARAAREADLDLSARDHFSTGADGEAVRQVADSIKALGGDAPEVTVLPLQFSSPQTGPVELPLFRVQDETTGEDRFVDNLGRQYESFEDWQQNNKLPPGNVVVPTDGHLRAGEDGQVALTSENTHATVDTVGEHIWQAVDTAALVGGVVAGGAIVIGSGGTAAPVILAGVSAYGAAQYADDLHDRATHGQTLSLRDPGARSMWLGLSANALGFSSIGTSMRARQLATLGRESAAFNRAVHGTNMLANAADTAAIADSAHALMTRWDELPPGERAQRALEIAFYGVSIPARRQLASADAARVDGPESFFDRSDGGGRWSAAGSAGNAGFAGRAAWGRALGDPRRVGPYGERALPESRCNDQPPAAEPRARPRDCRGAHLRDRRRQNRGHHRAGGDSTSRRLFDAPDPPRSRGAASDRPQSRARRCSRSIRWRLDRGHESR